MAIPSIAPYPMPTRHDLPLARAAWSLDAARAVLLIHDMQNYFLEPFRGEPLPTLLTNIARVRAAAADAGVPVVYSAQPGAQSPGQRGLLRDLWGDGIGTDPREALIVDALAPDEHDVLIVKSRYSAFVRTDLADLLAATGRDQLIVTGVYAHIGCQATAVEAFMRDVQPFLVADALADFSAGHHHAALAYTAAVCAVPTVTGRAIETLSAAARPA